VDDDDLSDYEEHAPPPAAAYATDANSNRITVEQIFGWRMPLSDREKAAEKGRQAALEALRVQRVAALRRGESVEPAGPEAAAAQLDAKPAAPEVRRGLEGRRGRGCCCARGAAALPRALHGHVPGPGLGLLR
jgi:hypothetical protein